MTAYLFSAKGAVLNSSLRQHSPPGLSKAQTSALKAQFTGL